MPSHLTREVFRRLLANEPIVHRGCLRRQQQPGVRRHSHSSLRMGADMGRSVQSATQSQRRTLFNLASMFGKKREPAGASIQPGLEKMMELEKRTRLRARLPPPEEVATALLAFARSRGPPGPSHQGMEDNQARLVLQSLRYCLRCDSERSVDGNKEKPVVSKSLLKHVTSILRSSGRRPTPSHIELGKTLYETARSGAYAHANIAGSALTTYVCVLARAGLAGDALNVVRDYENALIAETSLPQTVVNSDSVDEQRRSGHEVEQTEAEQEDGDEDRSGAVVKALGHVLEGFTQHGPYDQVNPVLSMILERETPGLLVTAAMQAFSLQQNDFGSALRWWQASRDLLSPANPNNRYRRPDQLLADRTREMLQWCLENKEFERGHQIVQELTAANPSKPEWDAVFVWAAGMGKGVDEIGRMISVMVQANDSIEERSRWRLPDIDTINALVETAISQKDPYRAERFIALGRDRDIEPNSRTYVLQMDYRLDVNDVDGALTAYKNLQGMDLTSNSDVPVVNRLIVALCNTQRHDFDTIMNVAADLSDRRARFEPDTVTTLSLLHLRRDERLDVIDLLNTHAYHFSTTEREGIRNALVAFALDPNTPTASSWDTYTILRELFDELPRTQRTELMTSFIRRQRPDMGVHVFQNMRMHSRADTMPTIDTYVTAFMALAKARELDSLEVVHNQLKLDFNVQHSTYLLNALIIAYTACGKPRYALDFWDEIVVSREGPSYNSVQVALRACEKSPFGDLKAQEIWGILRKRGVELDQTLWAFYAAALAGNGDNELAFQALDEGVEKGEVEVDEFVLGSLFAAGANKEKQDDMERWARERYEDVWERLEGKGVDTNIAGMRAFKIDRSVAP